MVHLAHGWRRLKAVAVAILKVVVLYREALLYASSLLGWVRLDCCLCCASVVLMAPLVTVASVEGISTVVLFSMQVPSGDCPGDVEFGDCFKAQLFFLQTGSISFRNFLFLSDNLRLL